VATDHKFKVKNGLHTQNIEFVDSNNTHSITASMLTTDTLSFSGGAGQLFSLTDSMSGTIFSVNDVSGIPSIEVDDDGTIRLAETSGNILIGTGTDDGSTKLQIDGSVKVTGFTTSGQLDVGTQNIKIGNNYIYASGDSNSIHVNAVTSFIPDSTTTANNPDLGLSGYRWKGIYGGLINGTSFALSNGWTISEEGSYAQVSSWIRFQEAGVYTTTAFYVDLDDSSSKFAVRGASNQELFKIDTGNGNKGTFNTSVDVSGVVTVTGNNWYQFSPGAMGASTGSYGMGNKNSASARQLTFHVPNIAGYSNSGIIPSFGWYSNGSDSLMTLESASGDLAAKGTLELQKDETSTGDVLSLYGNRIGATTMYGFGVSNATLYHKAHTRHQFYTGTNYDGSSYLVQINSDHLQLNNIGLKVASLEVLDTSRNLTNIGTISSGNITSGSLTNSTTSVSGSVKAYHTAADSVTLRGYGLEFDRGASYIRPVTNGTNYLYFGAADATLNWKEIQFRSDDGLTLNGSTFIDASRNLTNIGTISSGIITSSGGSAGRYKGIEVVNTTNAGGTETAIGLGVFSASNTSCDVTLVANRVGSNAGSDFYIEQTDSAGNPQQRFRITESGALTFNGDINYTGTFNYHRSDYPFAFLTPTGNAQDVRTKSVFAGTTYGDTPPAGSINATNTYELDGTTVIDASQNLTNINQITATGNQFIFGGTSQTSTNMYLRAQNTAGAPARTAAFHFQGYENRAQGLFFTDSGQANKEWFAGIPYNASFSRFSIGYHNNASSQPEYNTNELFSVDTDNNIRLNNVTFLTQSNSYHQIKGRDGNTAIYLGGSGTGSDNRNYYDAGAHRWRTDNGQVDLGEWSQTGLHIGGVTAPSDKLEVTGNASIGDASNISMSVASAGQLKIKGNGYTGAIALDGSAMHIYHNSNSRSLVLGTNETARLTIGGAGGVTVTGALTSDSLYVDGKAVFDSDTGNSPLHINRLTTATTHTQQLQIWVDDANVVFRSEQDESGRYGGFQFISRHSGTNKTRYLIDNTGGDHYWYANNGNADMHYDATNRRLGIGVLNPTDALDVAGTINTSSHGDSSQWDTAYGWGDHGSAGYITSVTAGGGLTGGGTSGAVTVTMNWTTHDSFTGTYGLVWNASDVPYTASWLQVRGSDDTLLTRNIHPDGHIRIDNGSNTGPTLRFNVDQNTGLYRHTEGVVSFTSDGTNVLDVGKYLKQPLGYTFQYPASTQGWRKLARIVRGGGRFLISFTGGNFAPNTYVIDYYRNWSTTCNLKLEQSGTETYITGARLRTDSSDSNVYLEIYLNNTSSTFDNGVQVFQQQLLGYNAGTTVYTGALSVGSSSGTTHTEMDFLPQGSTFNQINVEGATTLDSTLNVGGQSTLARPVLVNGAHDNGGKADFAVDGGMQVSLYDGQVQAGGTDMNWSSKFFYDGTTSLGSWDSNIQLFSVGSNTGSASGRDIYFSPQTSGTGQATERMRIQGATGHVGIGVSNPLYMLHMNGGSSRTDVQVTLDGYGEGVGDGAQFGIQTQGAYIWNYENTDLYFATNNQRRLTINEDGNVGIGVPVPAYPLEISGAGTVSLAYQRTGTGVTAKKWGFHSDNSNTYWQNITDNLLAITVSNAGNVSIGNTSTASKLNVAGSVRITSSANDQTTGADTGTLPATSGADVLRIQGTYTNGQYTTEIAKIDRSGNLPLYIRESRGTANSFTNIMRIGGHGQTDGSYTAEVFGHLKVAGDILSTGNEHYFVSTNNYIEVDQNTGTRFRFHLNGAKQAELIRVGSSTGQFAVDQFSTNSTAAGYPAFTEMADTNTGLFFPAADEVGLTTGGTERLRVDSNGNVGIGTTDPQSFPRLDVRSTTTTNAHAIAAYGYATNGTAILANGYAGSGSGTNYGIRAVSTGDRGSSAGSINVGGHFSANGAVTNYALTTGSGYVGIGTPSPGVQLDVYDGGGSVNIIRARNSTQQIALGVNNTSGGAFLFVNTNHALRFGTNGTERMRISNSGNVGIGTGSSPQKVLDVVTANNDFVSFARQLSVNNWTGVHFGYRENNNVYRKSAIVFERTDLTSGNAQGKVHILNGPQSGNGNCTLSDAALTIRENGAVVLPKSVLEFENGSNTITASMLSSDTLSFSGDSGQLFSLTDSMSGTIFSVNDVSGIPSIEVEDDGTIYLAESTGNVLIGTGTDNGSDKLQISGSITASGNITAYGSASDINVKENIEVIPDAVQKVQKLEGVTFNYKKDGSRSTGLIAQQLQEVLPEVVYETTDLEGTEHLAVRYGNVVGLLVEALKEQQTQLTAQQEQINQLTSLVNKLMEK